MIFSFLFWVFAAVLNYLIIFNLVRKATKSDEQVRLLAEQVALQNRVLIALTHPAAAPAGESAPAATAKTDADYLQEAREKAGIAAA